jgi:serine/threonine protein kinase
MEFPEGSRLGPYEILSPIGAGGMGEVYRAKDTRLDRIVAIKVLPALASGDPEFRQRFEREARAISALDHPNICALHDVGTHPDGAAYLVMQYLEGETLAVRLARSGKATSNSTMSVASASPSNPASPAAVSSRGPLPMEQVLRFARDIALALAAAHHRGIVHRDLKPGNVMLTKSTAARPGSAQVKLLDFGLAKVTADSPQATSDAQTQLGAPGGPLTSQGSLLGTLPYMSPEQVEGRDIDPRSDLFSLGAMCYEMIVGRRPFDSPSQAGLVAAILTTDPPMLAELPDVRPEIAPAMRRALDRLLKKSLAKDADERWQCAADLAAELKSIDEDRVRGPQDDPVLVAPAPPAVTSRLKTTIPWAIAAIAGVIAAIVTFNRPDPDSATLPGPIWSTINLEGVGLASDGNHMVAVSPDGRQIALAVERDGDTGIAIRSLNLPDVRSLGRTRGANHLFWAPDGKTLGFFTEDALKTVDIASGAVRTICAVTFGSGGAWNADGTIIYSNDLMPMHRTSVAGGCGSPIAGADATIATHPYFLPDGRHFVAASDTQVWLGSLDGGWTAKLAETSRAEAVFAAPDWLLIKATSSEVQARRIDVAARALIGDPKTVLPWIGNPGGHTGVSTSATGVLVTQSRGRLTSGRGRGRGATPGVPGRFVFWTFDRDAAALRPTAIPDSGWAGSRLSRDGTRFAQGAWNLQVSDVSTGKGARAGGSVESGRDVSASPVWGPGDATVAYVRRQSKGSEGDAKIESVHLASGEVSTLFDFPAGALEVILTDWSHDGNAVAFERVPISAPATREAWEYDIRTSKVQRLFDAAGDEREMQYAPAGGWIAYTATASGESDVFLRPRSGDGAAIRVSSGGGRLPRWRADGAELFYLAADDAVMAVAVTWHPAPTLGVVKVAQAASALDGRRITSFDSAPDGRRFHLGLRSEVPALTLILDWWALLK